MIPIARKPAPLLSCAAYMMWPRKLSFQVRDCSLGQADLQLRIRSSAASNSVPTRAGGPRQEGELWLVAHSNFLAGVGMQGTSRANAGITQLRILAVTHTTDFALCGPPSDVDLQGWGRWPLKPGFGLSGQLRVPPLNSILKQRSYSRPLLP